MENLDKEYAPVVASKEQLLEGYPELFEELNVHSIPVYLEIPNIQEESEYLKTERVLILPSGTISISTKDTQHLWNISEEDTILLAYLNTHTEKLHRDWKDGKDVDLFAQTKIQNTDYGIKYYPYGDVNASANLIDLLDKKSLAKHNTL